MSPLRLTGSTSGYSQLDAPAVAGDQTFTLPGTGGTLDRLNRAGNILQVVQGNYSTSTLIASTSFTDTGLSASITPTSSSSKILILINQNYWVGQDTASVLQGHRITVLRDATTLMSTAGISAGGIVAAWNSSVARGVIAGYCSLSYLDSPGSTSSLTYKTRGAAYATSSNGQVYYQDSSNPSYITLIEVAA